MVQREGKTTDEHRRTTPEERHRNEVKGPLFVDARPSRPSYAARSRASLPELLDNQVAVRPQPSKKAVQHLCLDAAFDNEPTREVLWRENYTEATSRQGKDAMRMSRCIQAAERRRWVVERSHSWHDRFRRLVNNWEKKLERRYAFICLANALIAYRT